MWLTDQTARMCRLICSYTVFYIPRPLFALRITHDINIYAYFRNNIDIYLFFLCCPKCSCPHPATTTTTLPLSVLPVTMIIDILLIILIQHQTWMMLGKLKLLSYFRTWIKVYLQCKQTQIVETISSETYTKFQPSIIISAILIDRAQ